MCRTKASNFKCPKKRKSGKQPVFPLPPLKRNICEEVLHRKSDTLLIPEEAAVIRHLLGSSEDQMEVASTLLFEWPAVEKGGCVHRQSEIASCWG